MSEDIKEFSVDSRDFFSKSLYLVKEMLNTNKKLKIVANTISATYTSKLAENLRRLGYIEYDNIQTETFIRDNRRQTRLVFTVHVTKDFDKLYKESLEEKKKRDEGRAKKETKNP